MTETEITINERGAIKALSKIQKELNCPKGQHNKFGNYKYRSCEDILEAVKKMLPEDSTVTLSDEMVNIGDRYYVKATARFVAAIGEVSVTAFAREASDKKGMDDAQITGAASSYARKYALNGLFAIDDTKDSDFTNTHGNEPQQPKTQSSFVQNSSQKMQTVNKTEPKPKPKPQPSNDDNKPWLNDEFDTAIEEIYASGTAQEVDDVMNNIKANYKIAKAKWEALINAVNARKADLGG